MNKFSKSRELLLRTARSVRDRPGYWLRVLALFFLGILAEQWLDGRDTLLHFRYQLYQHQTKHAGSRNPIAVRTAFVAIDDDDFWRGSFERRLPLKRKLLGELITNLAALQPKAIVLDIDLRTPTPHGEPVAFDPKDLQEQKDDTQAYLKALQAVADPKSKIKLILPTSVDRGDHEPYEIQNDAYTNYSFGEGASNVYRGYLLLNYDLRTIPSCLDVSGKHIDSLAMAILHAESPEAYQRIIQPSSDGCVPNHDLDMKFGHFEQRQLFDEQMVRARDVLNPNPTPDAARKLVDTLAGKIVIVCGTWHRSAWKRGPTVDEYDTPAGLVPGAYLHGNYFEALADGNYFSPVSEKFLVVLQLLLILISAGLMLTTENVALRMAYALVPALLMVIFSFVVLQNLGAFFDCVLPVVVLLSHLVLEQIIDWRKAAHQYAAILLKASSLHSVKGPPGAK